MLNSSEAYYPNFIGCLLEIGLKHSESFRLDANSISSACLNSLQQPIGIVLLEEYIIIDESKNDADTPPISKKMKLSEDKETLGKDESILWIELAKLYRSMNDYDSIKGIFNKKANISTEYTKKGFYYESISDYFQARKCYMDALNHEWNETDNISKIEEELWEQSLLRCCNELTDWKAICEWTTEDTSLNSLFKDDTYTLEQIFPYAFRSKLKIILQESVEEQKRQEDLIKFIHSLDSEGKKYLEQGFALEMALINLHQKDFNAAKYFGHIAIQKYLTEWAAINKSLTQTKIHKLQFLQSIVELNEFLRFIDNNPSYNSEINTKIENLITLWSNSMPNVYSDPTSTWDDVITNRCIYYEFIEDKYYNNSDQDLEMSSFALHNDENERLEEKLKKDILKKIEKSKVLMKISFAQAAQYQGNFRLALSKLQQTRSIIKSQQSHFADLQIVWMQCYLGTHLARSKSVNNPEEALNMFLNAATLKEILKYDDCKEYSTRKDLYQKHQILHAHFCKFLIDSLIRVPDYYEKADEKKRIQLDDYTKLSEATYYEERLNNLIKLGVDRLSHVQYDLKASLELASYCDYFLRMIENEEEDEKVLGRLDIIKNKFPSIIIEQLLNAIRLNSYEARQRFPRLLQIVETYYEQTSEVFLKSIENIPSWMFLGWLSQITALLDKPIARVLNNIVEKIANEYPQAFIYPFKMSLESYKFDFSSKVQKEFVNKLKEKIKTSIVNQFIQALEQLTSPVMLFKDYKTEIFNNIKNRENVVKIFREIYMNLIDESSSQHSIEVEWGKVRKTFAENIKTHFDEQFGVDGSSILHLSEESLREKFKKLDSVIEAVNKNIKEGNLGDYSPWLKEFKRNLAKDLEIPGQYTGKSKPLPEYHIKIESFDERLIVMSSIRRPKCITIRGNDQKEHKFLVKGGEDQRQDQRIETLFDVINDLLKSDSKCYQKNLSLRTYQVIPMTTKLALIEWLPETRTLKDVIYSARTEDEQRQWETKNPAEIHHKFITDASKSMDKWSTFNITDLFGLVYVKYNHEYVSDVFEKIQSLVPWDLLRRFIQKLSLNTESYFMLRNNFVSSYAVASACHYILGIGDRHLSNWMIDLKSGKAIGIDFGMAFGYSTMHIPVPELIPIRLTRQILKLAAPLEESGLLEASMIHTLKALRENNDLLMCILDVFIKEPSIDWIGSATRIAKRNLNEDMQLSVGIQYAKSRVNSSRNKLNGINPCVITKNDLNEGIHKEGRYIKHYLDAVLAVHKTNSMRSALLKEKGERYRLTVEEQVKCIIDQATDPCILARTYTGWEPFI